MTSCRSPVRLRAFVLGLALLAIAASPIGRADDAFVLNLERAELRSLIDTVAQRTGRNFVVDPRVDARITVISSVPVDNRELYEVFRTVLRVHGYAAIDEGDITKIVPSATAKHNAVPLLSRGERQGGIVTRVVEVDNVSPSQLVPILRPLLPQEAHLAAYEPSNRLVLTDSARNVARVADIVAQVDRPIERDIEIVRLKHATAADVVEVLGSLQDTGGDGGTRLTADARTNSVLIRAAQASRVELRTLIANLDTPIADDGSTRVIYLDYAQASELVETLQGVSDAQSATGASDSETAEALAVQADEATNALILTGPPERLRSLETVIAQLDIRRAQVLVEAIIAELSTDRARELGVQLAADAADREGVAAVSSFADGGSNIVNLVANPQSIASGLTAGALGTASGNDFGVLLRALASDSDNNILSTPSLLTLDNQEAEIVVGQNVPFITGQFTGREAGDGGARSPFQTIEREDVGLTLRVTPQINTGDSVRMEIEQEVSNIAETAQAADLVTNTRSLKTTVLVDNRQMLVLGGLIDDTVRTRREKVPLLGDIPLLGRLFRYDRTSRGKQNLMVFLQPQILRQPEQADAQTRQRYNAIREEQIRQADGADGSNAEAIPILPKLELEYAEPAES